MKKILFTSVGRRVELIQTFRNAAIELGVAVQIIGGDISLTAPALFFCDKTIQTHRIKDEKYIPHLIEFCKNEKVDLLIPTIDTDLLLLSQNVSQFAEVGTRVLISKEEKIKICRDKILTATYFNSLGLKSPLPVDDYLNYNEGFPAFIKPKDGSSSISAYKVNNQEELESYAKQIPNYIVQPFIEGVEYTVDVFCDFYGNPICITPRERVSVRSGEVLKTRIHQDDEIVLEVKKLIEDFKPCGPITIQLIKQLGTNKNFYIEINPRYGGGSPLSMRAGANSAIALIKLLCGEEIDTTKYNAQQDMTFSRFDQSVSFGGKQNDVRAIIFDLDDTLYSEKDYVYSGIKTVCKEFENSEEFYKVCCESFKNKQPCFDVALTKFGIKNQENIQKCLKVYREHNPQINLYEGVEQMLKDLRAKGVKTAIITDGRPEGQRKKISALGLDSLVDDIIITDELGGEQFRKPNDISYRIIQRRFGIPFEQMAYVGDNCSKDFHAPRQLGMKTILFKNKDGLYCANCQANVDYVIEDNVANVKEILFNA